MIWDFNCLRSSEESIDDMLDGSSKIGMHWYLLVNERTDLVLLIGSYEVFRYVSLVDILLEGENGYVLVSSYGSSLKDLITTS